MVRLVCPQCGLSYAGATLPQYLAATAGASCPRCGTPLTESRHDADRVNRPRRGSAHERHQTAVDRTLGWAEQAAADGSHGVALSWLATIEAIDGKLPPGIEAKRRAWAAAGAQAKATEV